MKNADKPIHPTGQNQSGIGLTKREHAAIMAMQGLLASDWGKKSTGDGKADVMVSQVVKCSVTAADALFAELEKTNQ